MGRIITHTYLLKHWLQSGHKHVTNSKCLTSHGTSMETKEQEKLRSLYLLSPTPKVLNKSVPRVPISKSASPSSSTP